MTKEQIKNALKFLSPFFGILFGWVLSEISWQNKTKTDDQKQLTLKKLDLIEKTSSIFSKRQVFNELYNLHERESILIKENKIIPKDYELSIKLGELKSEFQCTLVLDKLFFSSEVSGKIDTLLLKSKKGNETWWNLESKYYSDILESMTKEIQ